MNVSVPDEEACSNVEFNNSSISYILFYLTCSKPAKLNINRDYENELPIAVLYFLNS